MFFQLELLALTYIGTKIYEVLTEELPPPQRIEEDDTEKRTTVEPLRGAVADQTDEERQFRYVTTSAAAMGLFAARSFLPGGLFLGMATYLYSAIPYMKNVEKSLLRDRKINVDVLFFTADALTFGTQNYFTAAFGLYLIHTGKFMVERAKDDSAQIVRHLFKELPKTVWVRYGDVEIEIPLEEVKADDLLIVNSGGVIPVDGVIREGAAQIDQQALTGEAQPAEKKEGDCVFANTIVMAGKIVIQVNTSGEETTSAQIADTLLKSVSHKSGVQLMGEKWADQMTFPMFVSSLAALPFIGPASTAVFINSHIGVRIKLYAPLTTLRHISEASMDGVLVKDGRALEQLCLIDTMLFDKTGTLTTGQPEVKSVTARGRHTEDKILAYAAAAECKQTHPIARAILEKARQKGISLPDIEDAQYHMGYGISVQLEGKRILVGSDRYLEQEGIKVPKVVLRQQETALVSGNIFVLVGVDRYVGGFIELQPQIRPGTREMISRLRALGVNHLGIVSGDHQSPTRKLAGELGMDTCYYNILPEDKAKIVEDLQTEGRTVCFMGDGINDSIALKKANVSISVSGANSIAQDMADIVFMDGTLNHLVDTVELSKRLDINLRRSLALCLIPGMLNFAGAFILNFKIMTSLLINSGFGFLGASDLFYTRKKELPESAQALPALQNIQQDTPRLVNPAQPLTQEDPKEDQMTQDDQKME